MPANSLWSNISLPFSAFVTIASRSLVMAAQAR